jgi:cation diffusion facilitator family transporter
MSRSQTFDFPPEQRRLRDRARQYAWRSIILGTISGAVLYVTTGRSQTMKTMWITDFLSIVPSIALIVALRRELQPPSERYPFGHFRAISICFLLTATVLLSMGVWLLGESVFKLARLERPPIGAMVLFGHPVWAGWIMIGALTYSLFTGMYLGRIKQPLAEKLHSKAIEAESATNRNEWMSEGAAIIGVVLVGVGFWWADSATAGIISLQIVREGWQSLRQVIGDLMDEAPTKLGTHELEDLPGRVQQTIEQLDWVREAVVRLREHGHLITGEVLVVPRSDIDLVRNIESAQQELHRIDWRLHSLAIVPVSQVKPLAS